MQAKAMVYRLRTAGSHDGGWSSSHLGMTLKPLPGLVIFAQIGLGVYLGTTFTPEVVATHRLLIPTAIFSVVIVLLGVILGVLIHRFWDWTWLHPFGFVPPPVLPK